VCHSGRRPRAIPEPARAGAGRIHSGGRRRHQTRGLAASKLSEYLGQQFVIENRPGAGTNIANEAVAKAAPDGYTLLFNSPAVAINMSLYKNPPYDALRDLAAVSVFSESTNILVVPASLPVKSVKELIALAKEKPGALNYSSAGPGTTQHLAAELFKLRTGTSIVHVPYKGSAPSLTALISGDVQLSFVNPVAIGQHIKSEGCARSASRARSAARSCRRCRRSARRESRAWRCRCVGLLATAEHRARLSTASPPP